MNGIPKAAEALIHEFADAFTQPAYRRFVVLMLAVPVKFPFAQRRWALPVLVALHRSKEWNREHGRRHKTPSALIRQLLAVLIRWFPQ